MAVINCRVCGEEIEFEYGTDRVKCENCGFVQSTAPDEPHYVSQKERKRKRAVILAVCGALVLAAGLAVAAVLVVIPASKYNNAIALFEEGNYGEAFEAFTSLGDYKDSAKFAAESANAKAYAEAEALLAEGKYDEARRAFKSIKNYKDSSERVTECDSAKTYAEAENLLAEGDSKGAAMLFGSISGYNDAQARSFELWRGIVMNKNTIAAGFSCTVAVTADKGVVTTNQISQSDFSSWDGVVAVSTGEVFTLGLKSDGTVIFDDFFGSGQHFEEWNGITAILVDGSVSVGLKADGTVIATGDNTYGQCNVSGWKDIVSIAGGGYRSECAHTVGLKADGTVVATGGNSFGQCNVSEWTDIIGIAVTDRRTMGIRRDGTVVITDISSDSWEFDVTGWTDIIALAAGEEHIVGLRADGTVVAAGRNSSGQCDVSEWTDIVAIAAGWGHTVGLKADGTVVATGWNEYGQCNVSEWKDIMLPDHAE